MNRNILAATALVLVALAFVGLRWSEDDPDAELDTTYSREARGNRYAARSDAASDADEGVDRRSNPARRGFGSSSRNSTAERGGSSGDRAATGRERGEPTTRGKNSAHTIAGGRSASRNFAALADKSRRLADRSKSTTSYNNSGSSSGSRASGSDERVDRLRGRAPTRDTLTDVDDVNFVEDDPDAENADEGESLFDPLSQDVQNGVVDRGANEDPLAAQQVDFLPEDGGVRVGPDSVLSFPANGNIDGKQGTIKMVIEPDWSGAEDGTYNLLTAGKAHQWENRIVISKNHQYLRVQHFANDGTERGLGIKIDHWPAGQQHAIEFAYNQDMLDLYVDDELVSSRPAEGAQIDFSADSTIEVGSQVNRAVQGGSATLYDLLITK